MTSIFRVVTTWSGFNGAPGYTNLFFRNVLPGGAPTGIDEQGSSIGAHERVHAFFNAIRLMMPDDVKLTVEPQVDELEDTTGALVASRNVPGKPVITGGQPGSFSAATGAVIAWNTGTVLGRRRIRGRTFIVPLSAASFNNSGRVNGAEVAGLQTEAQKMAIGGINSTFGVWARPVTAEQATEKTPARDGKWAECTSVRVTDLPAVLRSRRD